MSNDYSPVRKLAATDQAGAFDCGQAALNQFLQRYALVNQKANSAQTYVFCQGDVVVGFYSLAARQWYESWELDPGPTDPYHLFLMLKDLKGMLS